MKNECTIYKRKFHKRSPYIKPLRKFVRQTRIKFGMLSINDNRENDLNFLVFYN